MTSSAAAQETRPRWLRPEWLVAALVVIALALRLPLLGDPVWFDEACMSNQRIGTFDQLVATIYVDIHPPFWITFMHLWNRLFGDGEWSLRLPPLLVGLATIPLLFVTGRRLVGETAALWAAALLALSPAHVWYSAEGRLYTALAFTALLAVWSFGRILVRRDRRLWVFALHVLNIAVMLALHYYLAIYVVLLAAIAPLVARGFSRSALRLLCWHGFGLLLLAGFVFAKQRLGEFETSQEYLRELLPQGLYDLFFVWNWTGNALPPLGLHPALARWLPEGLALGLVGLGIVHLLGSQRRHRLGVYVPAFALTIPAFLVLSAWAGLGHTFIERSCLPSLPFFLLIVGAGIAWLPRRLGYAIGGLALLLAGAADASMYAHRQTHWTVYKPKPDWRAAARWLGEEIDRGGDGRAVFTSMPNARPLPYYDVRIQDEKNLLPPMTPDEIRAKVGKHLGSMVGDFAGRFFERFQAHNRALLEGAKLRLYKSRSEPDALRRGGHLGRGESDGICYLLQNLWHPPRDADTTVEDLLENPKVEVLESHEFPGIRVYKVRIAP